MSTRSGVSQDVAERAERARDRRADRWDARGVLWRVSTVQRCRQCGRTPTGEYVALRSHEGRAAWAGTQSCGRSWLCPVCNAKVMASRSLELAVLLAWVEEQGYSTLFGALTLWHLLGDPLAALWDAQGTAWRFATEGREWQGLRARVVGMVVAQELTLGVHGWHPHRHPLVILDHRVSRDEAEDWSGRLIARWQRGVMRQGLRADAQAQDLHLVGGAAGEVGRYLTDATYGGKHSARGRLDLELTGSQRKSQRGRVWGTRPHWSLLDSIAAGVPGAVGQWHEVEAASYGRRLLTWSRGLRAVAGVGAERSDEEIAATDLGSSADDVAWVTSAGWARLVASPRVAAESLSVMERDGWAAVARFWDRIGVEYVVRGGQDEA